MSARWKAVLFDLDGTLLDTLSGLAAAVNHVLREHGEPERTRDEVRNFVGNGPRRLIMRAFAGGESRPDLDDLVEEFGVWYRDHAVEGTAPYPGIPALLRDLRAARLRLAVVTNKEEGASRLLVERFFPGAFDAIAGGGGDRPIKPDPAAARRALDALALAPGDVLYVGDSGVDAALARAAGMDFRLCSWGFRPREELERLGMVVDSPAEILDAIP